jgi:IS30 family transposase
MRLKWKLSDKDVSKIISLYKSEVSQNQIAKRFNIDHSTVYYHLKKNDIDIRHKVITHTIHCKNDNTRRIENHTDFDGEKLNVGKSYKEYLQDDKERRIQARKDMGSSNTPHFIMILD